MIHLSSVASKAGKRHKMITVAQKVPSEIDWQILPAMAEVKFPTIAVTMIRIDAEVRIAPMDLLYVSTRASLTPSLAWLRLSI